MRCSTLLVLQLFLCSFSTIVASRIQHKKKKALVSKFAETARDSELAVSSVDTKNMKDAADMVMEESMLEINATSGDAENVEEDDNIEQEQEEEQVEEAGEEEEEEAVEEQTEEEELEQQEGEDTVQVEEENTTGDACQGIDSVVFTCRCGPKAGCTDATKGFAWKGLKDTDDPTQSACKDAKNPLCCCTYTVAAQEEAGKSEKSMLEITSGYVDDMEDDENIE